VWLESESDGGGSDPAAAAASRSRGQKQRADAGQLLASLLLRVERFCMLSCAAAVLLTGELQLRWELEE
jgi:hypothetical protein